MECSYLNISTIYGDIRTYGIAAAVDYDGCTVLLESFTDLCADNERIDQLVKLCNTLQLDPAHLRDVVEDFLNEL